MSEQERVQECLRSIRTRAEKVQEWLLEHPDVLPADIEGAIHVMAALADEATGGKTFRARWQKVSLPAPRQPGAATKGLGARDG